MRTLELTEEKYSRLVKLADESRMHPPGPDANDSVWSGNELARHMQDLFGDMEEEPDVKFIDRLYAYFPALEDFDVRTGERAFFKECLEALHRALPAALKQEPLVVGSYLMKIIACPEAAGFIITGAWELGGRMAIR